MDIKKSYLSMIRAFPGGWDAMAAALGFTRSALENRIYERKGQAVLVESALQMQHFSDTKFFARAVAADSGGVFIEIPSFDGIADMELLDSYMSMVVEEGKFAFDFKSAIADGKITRKEFKRLRDDMQAQQQHEMELLARIESLVDDSHG